MKKVAKCAKKQKYRLKKYANINSIISEYIQKLLDEA